MILTYKNIVQEMLYRIPQIKPTYTKELEELWQEEGEIPPHIAFGDVLNPYMINLLEKADKLSIEEKQYLTTIFNFLEDMALTNEVHVQEVVSVTVMARLGDDINLLTNALNYMGTETRKLSKEIEKAYGRQENVKLLG